jgi:hypothetical protein
MKRWRLLLAMVVLLLPIAWGVVHYLGGGSAPLDRSLAAPVRRVKNADALNTTSGWRYRQSQPHHWRYIMLQK